MRRVRSGCPANRAGVQSAANEGHLQLLYHLLAVVGGATVVIAALAAFSGNLVRDFFKQKWKLHSDRELEELRRVDRIKAIQPKQYAADQYGVYKDISEQLGKLQNAVHALWESASDANLVAFSEELNPTYAQMNNWSIFFEERHLAQLGEMMRIVGSYGSGKRDLSDLYTREEIQRDPKLAGQVREKIQQNRQHKEQFEKLLNEIRDSFRKKLSGHEGED